MFDLVLPEYDSHLLRNFLIIIALALAVYLLVFISGKVIGKPVNINIYAGITALTIAGLSIMPIFIDLADRSDAEDAAYSANVALITDTGVEIIAGVDDSSRRPAGYYTFSQTKIDRVSDVTLKTQTGNLLSCKIITNADEKTFDVQCLDPSNSKLVSLEDAISAS